MILPTKGILPRQALVAIGAEILRLLVETKTVSRLWNDFRTTSRPEGTVSFDWFVLALDLLFLFGAVDLERGRIRRVAVGLSVEVTP